MKNEKLDEMVRGWFVGNFHPTLYKTENVEIAVKKYKAGEFEVEHYHKIATEITVIVQGVVQMNDKKYTEGDIIVIEPMESSDFLAITDVITTVVKIPGSTNDKFFHEGEKYA